MKRISLLCLLLAFLSVSAQENFHAKYNKKFHFKTLSEQTLKFYDEAQNCWENTEESCIPFYQKMLASAKNRKECIPCAEIELARGYFFETIYDSSIIHLNNVLKNAKNQNQRLQLELENDAYNMLAANYSNSGDDQKAIHFLMKCAKRIDQLGHKDKAALLKVNLGVLYSRMDNYEKGIQYQKEAYYELKKLGILKQNAIIANNIASFYTNLDKADSTLKWSNLALKLAMEQKDLSSEISAYYLKASAFEAIDLDSGKYYIEKSIELAQQKNDSKLLATAYNIRGNIYSELSNYQEAKTSYLRSIQFYEEMGNHPDVYAPLKMLGLEAAKHNDYEIASKYLSQYVEFKDSLVSEENRQLVHELNTKYETEKKEKQIAEQDLKIQKQRANLLYAILGGALLISVLGGIYLYNRKAQEIKLKQLQQEKENAILSSFIRGEERERNRISYELHDGVAAMIGAAKMNLETIPHLPPEKQTEQLSKVKEILENTHADVRHIAHNLLPTVLEKDGIIKATQHFVSEINQTQLIQVSVLDEESKAEQLSKQLQLMLFRIIQELINNTIKHSQAQNAVIRFSRHDHELQIEVSDDGIGYDGDLNEGNQGLYSIGQRLKSIGGNFKFVRKNDRGMQAIAELKV